MFLCDTCVSRRKVGWFGIMDKVTVIIIRPKSGMDRLTQKRKLLSAVLQLELQCIPIGILK